MQAQMDPRELARQIAGAFPGIDSSSVLKEPIIIVSAPRSGSNLLFEQLAGIGGLSFSCSGCLVWLAVFLVLL